MVIYNKYEIMRLALAGSIFKMDLVKVYPKGVEIKYTFNNKRRM